LYIRLLEFQLLMESKKKSVGQIWIDLPHYFSNQIVRE